MGIPMDRSDFDVDAVWAYLLYTCPALVEQLEVIDLRLSAARLSRELGFNSSSRLEDWLQRNSLPRFALLKDWYYVTALHRAAQSGVTLSRAATMQGRYVSILSRFVLRVTGESWRELRTSSSRTIRRRAVDVWVADRPSLLHASRARSHLPHALDIKNMPVEPGDYRLDSAELCRERVDVVKLPSVD